MMLLLAVQVSLLARPLHLDEAPPELRAARGILIAHSAALERPAQRTPQEALALAEGIVAELRAGAEFGAKAAEHDEGPSARYGSHFGAYPRGVLPDVVDEFLWAAAPGEISPPLATSRGYQIVQREEPFAGVRQVTFQGERAAERARELYARATAGESFAELMGEAVRAGGVAEHASGEAVFVRGFRDQLVKALAFETPIGSVALPMESPLGWHVVQRVAREELPASALEPVFIRARGMIVAWRGATAADPELDRSKERAFDLAQQIHQFVHEGRAPFVTYVAQWNDDPGGRERLGDLGWLFRGNPELPAFVGDLFRRPIGELTRPIETTVGYVLLVRER